MKKLSWVKNEIILGLSEVIIDFASVDISGSLFSVSINN